jgi:hypothetical protein
MDAKLLNHTIMDLSETLDQLELVEASINFQRSKADELRAKLRLISGRLMDIQDDYRTPENWE